MKIVLMADNRKTELLVNFCIAYKPLLEKHQLISVYNTAKLLKSAADLDVSGLSVDYQVGESNPFELLDVCDQNTIPYATNIASAEILVTAIDSGALDYREWNAV